MDWAILVVFALVSVYTLGVNAAFLFALSRLGPGFGFGTVWKDVLRLVALSILLAAWVDIAVHTTHDVELLIAAPVIHSLALWLLFRPLLSYVEALLVAGVHSVTVVVLLWLCGLYPDFPRLVSELERLLGMPG